MSKHAYDSPMSARTERIEVITRSERRRHWSVRPYVLLRRRVARPTMRGRGLLG